MKLQGRLQVHMLNNASLPFSSDDSDQEESPMGPDSDCIEEESPMTSADYDQVKSTIAEVPSAVPK